LLCMDTKGHNGRCEQLDNLTSNLSRSTPDRVHKGTMSVGCPSSETRVHNLYPYWNHASIHSVAGLNCPKGVQAPPQIIESYLDILHQLTLQSCPSYWISCSFEPNSWSVFAADWLACSWSERRTSRRRLMVLPSPSNSQTLPVPEIRRSSSSR